MGIGKSAQGLLSSISDFPGWKKWCLKGDSWRGESRTFWRKSKPISKPCSQKYEVGKHLAEPSQWCELGLRVPGGVRKIWNKVIFGKSGHWNDITMFALKFYESCEAWDIRTLQGKDSPPHFSMWGTIMTLCMSLNKKELHCQSRKDSGASHASL